MSRRFIGVGMCRRVFSLGDGTCIKEPIPGREEAGVMQNTEEYETTKKAEECGIDIFPKIISFDGHSLVSEECEHTDYALWKYIFDTILQRATGKKSDFSGQQYLRWFFFNLNDIVGNMIHDTRTMMLGRIDPYPKKITMFDEFRNEITENWINPPSDEMAYFLPYIVTHKERFCCSMCDLIRFKIMNPDSMIIAEMWNDNQWGINSRQRLVILDSGFTYRTQNSGHYRSCGTFEKCDLKNNPGENTGIFNGIDIKEIRSPNGGVIDYKFFTEMGSEYILSSDGMSRRIKQAGKTDDGLHSWKDSMIFVKPDDIFNIMNCCEKDNSIQRPTRIDIDDRTMRLYDISNDTGEWRQIYTADITHDPRIGLHTFEYNYDGDGIIRGYHPGHKVTQIDYTRKTHEED